MDKIRSMAARVAESEGLSIVDVEIKGGRLNQLLRIYIDKPGGITHADCECVSEQMSALLDVEDPFPGRYTLEVSSPGLERKLVKPQEFRYFSGRKARVVLRKPLEGQQVLEGTLAGFESDCVRIELAGGKVFDVPLAEIAKARLAL